LLFYYTAEVCVSITTLTFVGHVTSSVTWPFACPKAIFYRCSIGTDTLTPRDFEILRLKCIWVTVWAFLGHATSSVTWSFFPRYVVSYRCFINHWYQLAILSCLRDIKP